MGPQLSYIITLECKLLRHSEAQAGQQNAVCSLSLIHPAHGGIPPGRRLFLKKKKKKKPLHSSDSRIVRSFVIFPRV